MHEIIIIDTPTDKVKMVYAMAIDLVIFVRESYMNGKWESVEIGMTPNDLFKITTKMSLRKAEHSSGIAPPESERGAKQSGYGIRDDD